jgi:hypothetical protein
MANAKGSWTIPQLSMPEGGSSSIEYMIYQWVGIGGATIGCEAILQAGTASFVRFAPGRVLVSSWIKY